MSQRLKKQLWRTMKFFRPVDYFLHQRLSRKRYRHWIRQYRRECKRAWESLEPITTVKPPTSFETFCNMRPTDYARRVEGRWV